MDAPALTGLTWREFLDLPDDPARRHAELVDGEVVVAPPSDLHQLVVINLVLALHTWTRQGRGRGESTLDPAVQVSDRRGYLPDVAWWPSDRCAAVGQPPAFSGPPALAVEVLSPSTRLLDAQRKRGDYARIGVGELWLVDPAGPAVLVLRREERDRDFAVAADLAAHGRLRSPLLPGFALRVGDLVTR